MFPAPSLRGCWYGNTATNVAVCALLEDVSSPFRAEGHIALYETFSGTTPALKTVWSALNKRARHVGTLDDARSSTPQKPLHALRPADPWFPPVGGGATHLWTMS